MLLDLLDPVGVAVAAVSGALAAGRRSLDLFGVAVVAVATAVGGGTIRDVLLARPVFWIGDRTPLLIVLGAAALTVAVARAWRPPRRALLVADALALAAFSMSGAQVAEEAGAVPLVVLILGAITGAAGGVLRDLLLNEIPLVLQRGDLYVTAALAGIAAYLGLGAVGVPETGALLAGMAVVLGLRFASIAWGVRLPTFRVPDGEA